MDSWSAKMLQDSKFFQVLYLWLRGMILHTLISYAFMKVDYVDSPMIQYNINLYTKGNWFFS